MRRIPPAGFSQIVLLSNFWLNHSRMYFRAGNLNLKPFENKNNLVKPAIFQVAPWITQQPSILGRVAHSFPTGSRRTQQAAKSPSLLKDPCAP